MSSPPIYPPRRPTLDAWRRIASCYISGGLMIDSFTHCHTPSKNQNTLHHRLFSEKEQPAASSQIVIVMPIRLASISHLPIPIALTLEPLIPSSQLPLPLRHRHHHGNPPSSSASGTCIIDRRHRTLVCRPQSPYPSRQHHRHLSRKEKNDANAQDGGSPNGALGHLPNRQRP